MPSSAFPPGFLWGTASSAYQVEGSPLADGATPSIWHLQAHRRGRIRDRTTGDVACDHYRRWSEDVALLKDLGAPVYRFSVAWPRVYPQPGRVNPAGLGFYSRLVDALLAAGVRPCVTIFHWETPLWLEERGGFRVRESVEHLGAYGDTLFRALGDRVDLWVSINEPVVYSYLGYVTGTHAPGRRLDVRGAYHATHHLLLAHARLRDSYRTTGRGGRIGIANHNLWITARRERDVAAAAVMDDAANRFYWDPLLRGTYPETVLARMGRFLPRGFERDLDTLRGREDFVGVNYYCRRHYQRSLPVPYLHAREWVDPAAPRSAMWEIYPEGLYRTLARLRDEYGNPPTLVTENGYPLPDRPGTDPVDDGERIDYLKDHVEAVHRAIGEGADCRGYFHWSLTDNFEWDLGQTMRFGLARVDFDTQRRTPRRSYRWYRDLVRTNGAAR